MTRRLPIAAILFAAACGVDAEEGVDLLVPSDVEFSWNEAYNDEGLAAVIPLDVMVYERESGEPVAGTWVQLSSDAASFVQVERVVAGDPACATCVWDAYRDEYVELPDDAREMPLVVATDATGLARVYAVVDEVQGSVQGFEPVQVNVQLGDRVERLRLLPDVAAQ